MRDNPVRMLVRRLHLSMSDARRALSRKTEYCEVCGSRGPVVADHCHKTHVFRGWLCNGCNAAEGFLRGSPERARLLALYMERNWNHRHS